MTIAQQNEYFTIEVTTTALCNLGCSYCFEGVKTNTERLDDKVELVKQRIWEFYRSDFFRENYKKLKIDFWGGEPTLNPKLIVEVMQEFQHLDDVSFHIYTNGYNRKRLDMVLDQIDTSKLAIQFSYDGKMINDLFRLTHSGKPTSAQVIENFEYVARKGILVSLKATIPFASMKSLYSAWKDYRNLHERFREIGPNTRVSYAPTIDYSDDLPREKVEELVATFREQMLIIAKEEIEFYNKYGYHLCSWFGGSDDKVHCASGAHMHAIDVDGKSYACHGSLYSPNKELMQGSDIHHDNWVEEVEAMSRKYVIPIRDVTDTCKDCVATTCMICPVASLDNSKKEDYFDRWTDRWVNNMCGFFKAFGEIDRTVQAYLHSEIKTKQDTEV